MKHFHSSTKLDKGVDQPWTNFVSSIFHTGGGSLFAIHSECECYNPKLDRWFAVSPMLFRRSRAGVAAVGKRIYVVGG